MSTPKPVVLLSLILKFVETINSGPTKKHHKMSSYFFGGLAMRYCLPKKIFVGIT
jgi:hypothetical protein